MCLCLCHCFFMLMLEYSEGIRVCIAQYLYISVGLGSCNSCRFRYVNYFMHDYLLLLFKGFIKGSLYIFSMFSYIVYSKVNKTCLEDA